MADKILKLKINLSKIDKSKLFKSEKTGAVYLDATLLYNEAADQYENNGMILQDVTKEEREAGKKGEILGNAKEFNSKKSSPKKDTKTPYAEPADEASDDLPF